MTENVPMNPSASPSTQPTSALPTSPKIPLSETPTPTPAPNGHPESQSKPKPKVKAKSRARPRRRVASSDAESDAENTASDDSLTERSASEASEASEDEEDEDAVEDAVDHPVSDTEAKEIGGTAAVKPKFADMSSITPTAWADEEGGGGQVMEMSFEEFNRGGRGRPVRGRGRGRGGVTGEVREKREYTEAETKKYEAVKAKRKEKVKARKAELRESKKKEREAAAGSGAAVAAVPAVASAETTPKVDGPAKSKAPKGKPRQKVDGTSSGRPSMSSVIASTSALTIDDTASSAEKLSLSTPLDTSPPKLPTPTTENGPINASPAPVRRGPRVDNREAYAQRIANDPKFTPRVGNFWTHDQRHYDAGTVGDGGYTGLRHMSDYWRGRGGPPRGGLRGGFRGRGRGGFMPGPGPFHNGPRAFGAKQTVELSGEPGKSPTLEMDKLEAELEEAREKAQQDKLEPKAEPVEQEPSTNPEQLPSAPSPASPVARKWGHEGYVSMKATEQFSVNRALGRGRGRGRGGFAPRGGHFGPSPPASLTVSGTVPDRNGSSVNVSAQSIPHAPASIATPESKSVRTLPDENLATQPAADSLLADQSEAVTVRLPGSEASAADTATPVTDQVSETAINGSSILHDSDAAHSQEAPQPQPASLPPTFVPQSIPANVASPVGFANGLMPSDGSHSSPQPVQAVQGSESGSISSAGHFVPNQLAPQYPPPGVGVGPNGEYYNLSSGAPIDFRPAHAPRTFFPSHPHGYPVQQQQQQFFPPPSYSPDPYSHQHRGSFSSQQATFFPGPNGYPDARAGSPFGPPFAQSQLGGYFTPARATQKVSIRAPTANGNDDSRSTASPSSKLNPSMNGNGVYPSIQQSVPPQGDPYYSQHYNPYAAGQGMTYDGSMSMGEEGAYFPGGGGGYMYAPNPPQQYGGVTAGYGYEGEYPGY